MMMMHANVKAVLVVQQQQQFSLLLLETRTKMMPDEH